MPSCSMAQSTGAARSTVPGREQNSQEVLRRGMPPATSAHPGKQTEFLPEYAQAHQAVCRTRVPGFPVSILSHLLFVVSHWHRHQRMGRKKTETGTLPGEGRRWGCMAHADLPVSEATRLGTGSELSHCPWSSSERLRGGNSVHFWEALHAEGDRCEVTRDAAVPL